MFLNEIKKQELRFFALKAQSQTGRHLKGNKYKRGKILAKTMQSNLRKT